MAAVTILTPEGVARIPLGKPARGRRRASGARGRWRRALGLTAVLRSRGSRAEPDPLVRFAGCLDLGASDVAERHDAYLADAASHDPD